MQATSDPKRFRRALIVSPDQAFGHTHQTCLRHCGVERFAFRTKGLDAARLLADRRPDLILCEDRLGDMNGLDFLRLIRLHPELARIPALLVSSDGRGSAVRAAMEAGYSGVLLKPYSLQAMERQTRRLEDVTPPEAGEDASAEFYLQTLQELSLLTRSGPTQTLCRKGLALLKSKRYAEAREILLQAEAQGELPPEARLALAKAYQGLSDLKTARRCLERALKSFADQQRFHATAERFPSLQLPKASPEECTLTAQLARASYFTATPGQARQHLEAGRMALDRLKRHTPGQHELDLIEELESAPKGADLKVYLSVIGHTIKAYFKGQPEETKPARPQISAVRLQ